jgi:glutaminyl-peptide cyclotransferase
MWTSAPKRYDRLAGTCGGGGSSSSDHFQPEIAKGNFVTDSFYAKTPAGQFGMDNLIVKFPGKKDGIIVLASHYETNYPLKDIHFIGRQ